MINTVVVADTETSGLDPDEGAALLEVAWVAVSKEVDGWHYGQLGTYDWTYVAHAGPIPAQARAVHHIDPADVDPAKASDPAARVCTRDAVLHSLLAAEQPGEMAYCFHNSAFDTKFLPELTLPVICTYRCALHLYPQATSHSCQVLRYELNAEPPAALLQGLAPHRALYDTACTAALLQRMLTTHTPEELIALTTAPVLLSTVRFGKWRGTPWAEVPSSYLQWILRDGGFDADVVHTVKHHLNY